MYMSKLRQLRPGRDIAVAQRGPSENCVYMSKSRQLRPDWACSAGGVWWLCSCSQGRIACSARSQCSPLPVHDFCCVAEHYVPCCLCTPLMPCTPHLSHRVQTHVVLRLHEGPECGGGFSSEGAEMYVCKVRVARVSRVGSLCAAGAYTPSLQPGTIPGRSPAWKKCMIKRRRAIIGL